MKLINMTSGRVAWARLERLRAYYSEETQRPIADANSHLNNGQDLQAAIEEVASNFCGYSARNAPLPMRNSVRGLRFFL